MIASDTQRFSSVPVEELLEGFERSAPMPYAHCNGTHPHLLDGFVNVFQVVEPDYSPDKTTLVAYAGPSGAGQDTLLSRLKQMDFPVLMARTATTRARRTWSDEPEDAYTWMQCPDTVAPEKQAEYLIEKYELLECQKHSGAIYGAPAANIREIAQEYPGEPIVVKSDPGGIKTLRARAADEFNVVGVSVSPCSYRELWGRISDRDNQTQRIIDAVGFALLVPYVTDYVLRNRVNEHDVEAGITDNATELGRLLRHIGTEAAAC